MSYRTKIKLKKEQFIGTHWFMTNKQMTGKNNTALPTSIVEFDVNTDSIENAIINIDLNEIEELHIVKS